MDFDTLKKYTGFENKGSCSSGAFPSNGNFYNQNAGCICYFKWSIYTHIVYGGADTGFNYNRGDVLETTGDLHIPDTERTFQESPLNPTTTLAIDEFDWSMFKKNKTHSACTPVVTKDAVDARWSFDELLNKGKPTPPVTAENLAFIGTDGGYLYALEIDDSAGATTAIWNKKLPAGIKVSPTLWNSRLFVGCEDGMLYCFEAKTGNLLWRFLAGPKNRKFRMEGEFKGTWPVNSTVLIENDGTGDYAYFVAGRLGCDGTYVYKINPLTGLIVWQKNVGAEMEPIDVTVHESNATIISIAKGYLWIGGFREALAAGVKLTDGSVKRPYYDIMMNKNARGVYTGFFRDYLLFGGQYLYDFTYTDAPAQVNNDRLHFMKIKEDGTFQALFGEDINPRITPDVTENFNAGAWDNDYLVSGSYLYDADKFEAKLNVTYEDNFTPEQVNKDAYYWTECESLCMYSETGHGTASPILTGNSIAGVSTPSMSGPKTYTKTSFNLKTYKKDSSEADLIQKTLTGYPIVNGLVINRNGVAIIPALDGRIHFCDMGDAPTAINALTVVKGTESKDYLANSLVMLRADAPAEGQKFSTWSGSSEDVALLASPTSAKTTFNMPDRAVTLTAVFVDTVKCQLTVENGAGDGEKFAGDSYPISADLPPAGKVFSHWSGDTTGIEDVLDSTTTITIPDVEVATVKAIYKIKQISSTRVSFDFGVEKPYELDNWNNVVEVFGTPVKNALNRSGALTGISLSMGEFWEIAAGNDFDYNIPAYPYNVACDSFEYNGSNGSDGNFVKLSGLDPAVEYNIIAGSYFTQSKYEINFEQKLVERETVYMVSFNNILPEENGEITIWVEKESMFSGGEIALLEIEANIPDLDLLTLLIQNGDRKSVV